MKKNLKNNKKKGFTLVELIAVIAIIGILAAILVPTISGFITKAKKTKVVEQSRQFTMALESCLADGSISVGSGADAKNNYTLTSALGNDDFKELVGAKDASDAAAALNLVFPKLTGSMTYGQAVKITSGDSFDVDDNGVFKAMNS